MPTVLHPTVTDIGKAAAIAADAGGLELELTHLSFHDHYFVPDGTETTIPAEHIRVPIVGLRVSPTQIRLSGIWSDNAHLTNKDVGSIGVWAGSTLFAVYAKSAAPPFAVKTPSVDFVGFYEMALSVVPPNSVNVVISTDSALLAALVAHETATNPHSQYVRKDRIAFEAGRMVGLQHVSATNDDLKFTLPNQDVTGGYVDGMRVLLATTLNNNPNMTAGLVGFTSYPVKKGAGVAIGNNDIVPARFFELIFNATSFSGPYWILNLLGIDEQGLIIAGQNTNRTELLVNGCFQINTEAKDGFRPAICWNLDTFSKRTIKPFAYMAYPYVSDHWRVDAHDGTSVHTAINGLVSLLDPMNFPEAHQHLPTTICINRESGDSYTDFFILSNTIRNKDTLRARGHRVVLSFWVKKSTSFTDTVEAQIIERKNFTGGDKRLTEFGSQEVTNHAVTATGSWERHSFTATIDSDTTQIAVAFKITPTAIPSTSDYQIYFAGVSLKIAEVDDGYTQVPDYEYTRELCLKTYRGANGDYGTVINAHHSNAGSLIVSPEGRIDDGESLTTIATGTNTIKFSWINGGGTIAKSTATVDNWVTPPANWLTGHSYEKVIQIEFSGVTGDGVPGTGLYGTIVWLHDMIIDGRL